MLWFTGAAKVLEPYGPDALDRIDPGLAQAVRTYGLTADRVATTSTPPRSGWTWDAGSRCSTRPTTCCSRRPCRSPAFEAGRPSPEGWPSDLWTSWTPYTYPFNMTQQPALSVPCGLTTDRRPIGLQVVGPRHGDAVVLRVGRAFEALTPWHQLTPTLLDH